MKCCRRFRRFGSASLLMQQPFRTVYVKRLQELSQRKQTQQIDLTTVSKSIEQLNLEIKDIATKVKTAENKIVSTLSTVLGNEMQGSELYIQFNKLKRVPEMWKQRVDVSFVYYGFVYPYGDR